MNEEQLSILLYTRATQARELLRKLYGDKYAEKTKEARQLLIDVRDGFRQSSLEALLSLMKNAEAVRSSETVQCALLAVFMDEMDAETALKQGVPGDSSPRHLRDLSVKGVKR